jgi:outer membrane protein OmpA-like peptidoglycan-associated protein
MKTVLRTLVLSGVIVGSSLSAQTYTENKGIKFHPYAKTKRPDGKDIKADSGQHAVTSLFVDRRAKKWSIGLGAGPTFFFGDADKIQPSWHARALVKYSISQTFGIRAEYNIGQLKGARDFQAPTLFKDNFEFKSRFNDFSAQAVFTLGNISFLRPLRKTQLNLFLGLGWGSWRSEATFNDQRLYLGDYYLSHYLGRGAANPNLGKDVVETGETRNAIIPFGFGLKHNLGRYFDIGLDYRQTYMRNDDVDLYNTSIWQNRWWDQYSMLNVYGAWKLGNKNEQHYDWLSPVESIYDKIATVEETLDKLTGDMDGDGVSDFFDTEDSTEKDCKVYGDGSAVDTDGDGVPDCRDQEKFSPTSAEVDANGVAKDSDGDGIADVIDLEPNSPLNAFTDAKGRSLNANCCSCEDVVFPSVYFAPGSCNIRPEYDAAVINILDKMKQCPDKKLVICGIAGGGKGKLYSGKSKYSSSSCRSEAIINALVSKGISRDRIVVDNSCTSSNPNKVEFKMSGSKGTSAPGPRGSMR